MEDRTDSPHHVRWTNLACSASVTVPYKAERMAMKFIYHHKYIFTRTVIFLGTLRWTCRPQEVPAGHRLFWLIQGGPECPVKEDDALKQLYFNMKLRKNDSLINNGLIHTWAPTLCNLAQVQYYLEQIKGRETNQAITDIQNNGPTETTLYCNIGRKLAISVIKNW